MTWIETKLCKDDKDLAFYKFLWLILPENDSSYFDATFNFFWTFESPKLIMVIKRNLKWLWRRYGKTLGNLCKTLGDQ